MYEKINPKNMNKDQEQIEVGECYLSFGAESYVFQFAIQKYKDQDTQDCYSACFVWVWGLASHPEGRTGLRVFVNRVLMKIFRPK